MSDIPRLIADVATLTSCEWPEHWAEWCGHAAAIAAGSYRYLSGLSPEQAGRKLLADCWPGPFEPDYHSSPLLMDHHIWIYDTLERIVGVLRSGKWRLIDGSGKPVPPGQITLESFKRDDETLSLMQLVPAQAQASLTPQVAQAAASQEYRPAPPSMVHGKLKTAFEDAHAKGDPISARFAATEVVRPQLNAAGYDMSFRQIEQLGLDSKYAALRRPPGPTRKSKRH
jgi:hypothetical protein